MKRCLMREGARTAEGGATASGGAVNRGAQRSRAVMAAAATGGRERRRGGVAGVDMWVEFRMVGNKSGEVLIVIMVMCK